MSIINCPTCGKPGYENDETLSALRAMSWYEVAWADEGEEVTGGGMIFKVVATSGAQDLDSYGERIEGDFFAVLRAPDGRLLKREGYRDSYGAVEWELPIREVKPQPRTVIVYDYA